MMPSDDSERPITAAEAIALRDEMLRTDPEYRARVQHANAERNKRVQALREAEAPIVVELQLVGCNVKSVWDLVNTSDPYPAALPVLMSHLEKGGYPGPVMESLGRALAVKPASAWWDRLKELYVECEEGDEKEGLAVALAGAAAPEHLDDLIGLVYDAGQGSTRIYFLRSIRRLSGQAARELLEPLRSDPILGAEARRLVP
jgi:hypothetical protein